MASSGVWLYAASVSELCDKSLFQTAYRMMPKERQEKIDHLHFEKDKRLSIGAFLLLLSGLQKRGVEKEEIRIRYGVRGKPYLEGEERWHFNLSHSGEYAICAISGQEVGCDVERVSEKCRLNLAKRFFSAPEYEMILQREQEEEKNELFYRLWTLKESFVKTVGQGLYLPLNSFSISFREGGICVRAEGDFVLEQEYYFQEFSDLPGYRCALCGREERIADGLVVMEQLQLSEVIRNDFWKMISG